MSDSPTLESRILAFERAWQQGNRPAIADFLPAAGGPSDADRLNCLLELLCLDLEYGWRRRAEIDEARDSPRVEDYCLQFAELLSGEAILELIGEEYRARHRWGDRPGHEEYLGRFDDRSEQLRSLLAQIDREIQDESDDNFGPPVAASHVGCNSSVRSIAVFDPRAPLAHSDYLLQRLIGSGRMGKVYRAQQKSLDRPVAVKFLRKSFLGQPDAVERFIAEARTIARFKHPAIVDVHGLGRTPRGGYFIAMDLIDGPDLARVVARGPVAEADAVRWTAQACQAIGHAHRHGVVHCDLKPGNLLLGPDGRVRVTDFGLARSVGGESAADAGIEGTAPFMAPEQVSRHWGPIGPRTDVYGLGAVLYTLLAGQPPWQGPPWQGRTLADILSAVVSAVSPVSPKDIRPELSARVNRVCLRALAKQPQLRYATARDLHQDLKAIAASCSSCNRSSSARRPSESSGP